MQLTQFSMKPLADNLSITHDHRSNERVRAHSPTSALRQLKSPLQMRSIRACELGIHKPIDESINGTSRAVKPGTGIP
jgi:hypothetical protein